MPARRVEFEIKRPVNPDGISFVRYCWGALIGQLGQDYVNQHKRKISRLIQKLGFKLDELSEGGLIEARVYLETDENDEPYKMGAEDIKVYQVVKEIKEKVEVEHREK